MRRYESKIIALVSAGHFFSHFYLMLLPPLFPVLRDHFGVGFTELGLALTAFSVATGFTQVPVGFVVDRYGARRILIAGLVLESFAIAGMGLFPSFNALIVLLVLAGIANSAYHPADYSILSRAVDQSRMGRAFSVHTFAGFVGEAVAPVTILTLMFLFDWRVGLIACGLAGGVVAFLIWQNSGLLDGLTTAQDKPDEAGGRTGIRLLLSLPVVLGLLFFIGISLTGRGITGFGVSAVTEYRGVTLAAAGTLISCYLFAMPAGVLIGGWAADRITRHGVFAAGCFVVVALMMFIVGSLELSLPATGLLLIMAGLAAGMVAPSRDMLIRSITPDGQTGKVFGFVSTGYNIGGIVGPPLFGYLLDHAEPQSLFLVVGCTALMTMFTVLFTASRGSRSVASTA